MPDTPLTAAEREMLSRSLFYYCCGKDPTPILAFRTAFPLYLYVDLCRHREVEGEMAALCERLARKGIAAEPPRALSCHGRLSACHRALLSRLTVGGQGTLLLYLAGDANTVFPTLYGDILPRCIANIRYEMTRRHALSEAEEQVPLLLGHAYRHGATPLAEIPYHGDFGRERTVTLFGEEAP